MTNLKTIVLAGGTGTRLCNITNAINKSLLPIGDKPILSHIVKFALEISGQILVTTTSEQLSIISKAITYDEDFDDKRIYYNVQDEPLGIADAISYGQGFCNGGPVLVLLGDNIYDDASYSQIRQVCLNKLKNSNWLSYIRQMAGVSINFGAHIWAFRSDHPEEYGVVTLDNGVPIKIVEKPIVPDSNLIISGVYLFDSEIWEILPKLKPSARGEYEITDVLRVYMNNKKLQCHVVDGDFNDIGESIDSYWKIATKFSKWSSNDQA